MPGTWNVIGGVTGSFFAADFLNGDITQLYALDYDTSNLYTLDTATAARTLIGPATPGAGKSWSGMTDASDGTLYASGTTCSSSTLYTLDPATGATTAIGPITNGPCIIDIAFNAAGELYGVDIVNDVLLSIDPATGAGTVIGSIGFNANYAQGMDFDDMSGVLYMAAFNNASYQGEMRIIDITTGNTTLVGTFQNGDEVDGLAFAMACCGPDVPWLSENPVAGILNPDTGEAIVDVTMDSSVVPQPGVYHAFLKVKTDDPMFTKFNVPVTMTVVAPGYGVAISSDETKTGLPGETVVYDVVVTNASNGPPDSFNISLGTSTWTTSVDNAVVGPLAAGENAMVHVSVTVPPDVVLPDHDTVQVTATSVGDPTKLAVTTLTTNAGGVFGVDLEPQVYR